MSVRPHIQIRIIPDAIGFHPGQEPFATMRFTEFNPIVFIEKQTSALFLEHRETVAAYRRIVAGLSTVALDEQTSREALAALATESSAPGEDHHGHAPPLEEEFPQ